MTNILSYYSRIRKKIKKQSFCSKTYWENRYASNGTSGGGSYGRLAIFKAKVINDFIDKNQVSTVIEFGCGDGNQLSLLKIPNYIGFDVSKTILEFNRQKFCNDKSKRFMYSGEYNNEMGELVLSLDVIFHLIEKEVFENYMRILFKASSKYVIIYSSNKNEKHCEHVIHRKFSEWIEKNQNNWELIEYIPNIYSFVKNDENTSFSDFYIYKKINE